MKISEMIERLEQLKRAEGDIDFEQLNGRPFSFIEVVDVHPKKGAKLVERRSLASLGSRAVQSDHAQANENERVRPELATQKRASGSAQA
jgi:hypothetical protein